MWVVSFLCTVVNLLFARLSIEVLKWLVRSEFEVDIYYKSADVCLCYSIYIIPLEGLGTGKYFSFSINLGKSQDFLL